MIIDCIADLHGEYPKLEGGDLLIIAGDLTLNDDPEVFIDFKKWLASLAYRKIILIAGNHDNIIEKKIMMGPQDTWSNGWSCYLEDSVIEFEGLKIWGSPWTHRFTGINPHCMAFTYEDENWYEENVLNKIPDDLDILITHGPPFGILDTLRRKKIHSGSISLRNHVINRIKPRYHIFGHIHEWGGKLLDCVTTTFINASIMNEDYDAVNKPIRIVL